jgi:hypothetical protein
MSEVELFGYAIVVACIICAAIWLLVAGCILRGVWESVRGRA